MFLVIRLFDAAADPLIGLMADRTQTRSGKFRPYLLWFAIPTAKKVHLRVEVDYERLHFAYRVEGEDKNWRWLPQQFDASILSDEASAPGQLNFTGAFVGMACQDLAGTARPADFEFFEYYERNYRADSFEKVGRHLGSTTL